MFETINEHKGHKCKLILSVSFATIPKLQYDSGDDLLLSISFLLHLSTFNLHSKKIKDEKIERSPKTHDSLALKVRLIHKK